MALDFGQNHQGLIEGRHITGPRCAVHLGFGHIESGPTKISAQTIEGQRQYEAAHR